MDFNDGNLLAHKLCKFIRKAGAKGWCPGTGGNFSVLTSQKPKQILITRSGCDKTEVQLEDLLLVNMDGTSVRTDHKPSAETLLHCTLVEHLQVVSVFHTHSVYNTVLSQKFQPQGHIKISGYEMLKALEGITTHDKEFYLPIIANSQDMTTVAKKMIDLIQRSQLTYGFLLAGHGLYAWGSSIEQAWRHTEALEFLLECTAFKLELGTN